MSQRLFERKEGGSPLRLLLDDHLNKNYGPKNPLKVTLMGGMVDDDSIGDFVHLFDVYKFYSKYYEKQPIQFKFCSYVNDQFGTIERIYKDQFHPSCFILNKKDFDEEKFTKSQFLITKTEDLADEEQTQFIFDKSIASFRDQEGIINISFALDGLFLALLTMAKPPRAFIQSLCEYSDEAKGLYEGKEIDKPFIYDETFMGINDKAKGIKTNEIIKQLSKKDEKEKPSILESIGNKPLLDKLLSSKSSQEYLTTHSVACGYMQDDTDTENFILTSTATTTKKNVDIFVNTKLISQDELLDKLKQLGVTSIEIVNNSGVVTQKMSVETEESGKTVRLIHFPGTSEADKEKWISLSDCVAASGDSSLSELISSRKFPVFASAYKSGMMQNALISELESKNPKPDELIQYLKFTPTERNEEYKKMCDFARLNHAKILKQWQDCCDDIISKHDVATYLPSMIDHIIIASIIRKGDEKEISALLALVPEWKFSDTNFIFLAIMWQNTKILDSMKKIDSEKFQKLMNEKHPSQAKLPIDFAIKIKNIDMANKLLDLMRDKLAPPEVIKLQAKIKKAETELASSVAPSDQHTPSRF